MSATKWVYEDKTEVWDGNYTVLLKGSIMCLSLQKHNMVIRKPHSRSVRGEDSYFAGFIVI